MANMIISSILQCGRLYIMRGKQGRKTAFQTGPVPRNPHCSASKLHTKASPSGWSSFSHLNFQLEIRQRLEPLTAKRIMKSSNWSSNDLWLEFRVPAHDCHATCSLLIGCNSPPGEETSVTVAGQLTKHQLQIIRTSIVTFHDTFWRLAVPIFDKFPIEWHEKKIQPLRWPWCAYIPLSCRSHSLICVGFPVGNTSILLMRWNYDRKQIAKLALSDATQTMFKPRSDGHEL